MTRNGGRRTLQDRRLAELPNSKLTAEARDPNQNTTFSTESTGQGHCWLGPLSWYPSAHMPKTTSQNAIVNGTWK
jgi:hypothetical protein